VLLESDLPVGVVTGIAGNCRYSVIIEGNAGHAGAVPMACRAHLNHLFGYNKNSLWIAEATSGDEEAVLRNEVALCRALEANCRLKAEATEGLLEGVAPGDGGGAI
jgi:acetylornithine deacetylase/succinyl-diaminopimelate desuccinylase-like protein